MLPILTHPLALLALASLPALGAIYFFRQRHRRMPVSSLMLWRDVAPPQGGGDRLRRLETPLLFFLEMLALLLLVLAATNPQFFAPAGARPLVVVLDDSYSMLAGPQDSPRERGIQAILEELGTRPRTLVRFILAGERPQALGEAVHTRSEALEVLKGWRCPARKSCLDEALALAAEVGGEYALLLVVTDQAPPVDPEAGRIQWWAFGAERPNLAIVAASRSWRGNQERVSLMVANCSDQAASTEIVVETGNPPQEIARRVLRFDPRGETTLAVDLAPETPAVQARIAADALDIDDHVTLFPAPKRNVRVRVDVSSDALRRPVEKAVKASRNAVLSGTRPDLVVTERSDVDDLPADAWLLRIIAETDAEAWLGPFVLNRASPLVDGLSLQGVIWGGGKTDSLPGAPVVMAGNVPLLSVADLPKRKEVRLRWRPDLSTLQEAPAWPALIDNLIRWRGDALPELSRCNVRLGDEVSRTFGTVQDSVTVVDPDGNRRDWAVRDGRLQLPAERVGTYTIESPGEKESFAVNALNRQESDLTACTSGQWGDWTDERTLRLEYRPAARYLLLAALAVLTLHLLVAARSSGGFRTPLDRGPRTLRSEEPDMILLEPVWLFLLLPLGAAWWMWPLTGRWLRVMSGATTLLLVLALSGLAVRLPSRAGTVVVVADRSLSMPPGSEAAQKEVIDLLHAAQETESRLAVVSFGQKAAIEQPPQKGPFAGFTHEIGPDASHLAEALETAASLIPAGGSGRLLVLSDGRWTGRDPATVIARLAGRGIAIDYRPLQRPAANDLAIARIDAPSVVAPGESFLVTAWVQAPTAGTVTYELRRGGVRLAAGQRQLTAGLNRFTFHDQATGTGTQPYTLTVDGKDDPVPENNRARFLVGIQGPKSILHVAESADSGLGRLLKAGGLPVEVQTPEACDWSLENLSRHSAVVLENVPADKVGSRGMETLAAWVKETGAGLMMTGGRNVYGPGGYYRSPLEPILPVSMELRTEHRKLAMAIVVALDRSGSMAVPVPGGKVKMDLANLGTVAVLDLLGPMDEFGCIAIDTIPHTISPLAQVTNKGTVRSKIVGIESMGGGIFVYVALDAAARMVLPAKAGTKHIILFADAADAEEPGNYRELVGKCRKAGITVSVIGLGTTADKDAELLRDIAAVGGGRVFFTDRPEELPRLFAQDTFTVARNTFLDDPTPVQATSGLTALTGKDYRLTQPLGGYNLCYLRPEATLATVTLDEYKAPVVAAWQAGSGRALCYTGEADGKYAGAMAKWDQVGDYFTSLARWTAGPQGGLKDNLLLTQEVNKGLHRVMLHLDPERKTEPFTGLPRVTWLRAEAGAAPETHKANMDWVGPDTLALELPLRGSETALATVEVPGQKPLALPPVCLPYSPEFEPATDDGLAALERLGKATGGQERLDVATVWKDLPRTPRFIPLAPWCALAAALLLLLEVLERRTSWLSRVCARLTPHSGPAGKRAATIVEPQTNAPTIPALTTPRERPGPLPPPIVTPEPAQPAQATMLDALKQARKRSQER